MWKEVGMAWHKALSLHGGTEGKKTSCVGQDKVSYSILQNQDIRQHIKAETLHEKFILHYSAKVFLSLQCTHLPTRTWAKNKFIGYLTRSSTLYPWITMSHSKKPINAFPWTYKTKSAWMVISDLTQPGYWSTVSNLLQIIYLAFVRDPSHSLYVESQHYCGFSNPTILSYLVLETKFIFFHYKIFVSTYIFKIILNIFSVNLIKAYKPN
jgi:hypothetical protein